MTIIILGYLTTGPLIKFMRLVTTVGMISALAVGCESGSSSKTADNLRVSVLPDQSPERLQKKYSPLIVYLEKTTGLTLELTIHDSYEAFSEAFNNGEVDLAWFGALTFVRAENASGAEPLVQRDVDMRFVSHYIVDGASQAKGVADLQGKKLAFGSRLSTSGHLMPRFFMNRRDIVPEKFFSAVVYTGGHDQTAYLIRDGTADIGVVNTVILQSMLADGRIKKGELKVLEITPPYSNYVWAVRPNVSQGTLILLRDAFLALDKGNPEHSTILDDQGAAFYMPAASADYDDVRTAARDTGLLN